MKSAPDFPPIDTRLKGSDFPSGQTIALRLLSTPFRVALGVCAVVVMLPSLRVEILNHVGLATAEMAARISFMVTERIPRSSFKHWQVASRPVSRDHTAANSGKNSPAHDTSEQIPAFRTPDPESIPDLSSPTLPFPQNLTGSGHERGEAPEPEISGLSASRNERTVMRSDDHSRNGSAQSPGAGETEMRDNFRIVIPYPRPDTQDLRNNNFSEPLGTPPHFGGLFRPNNAVVDPEITAESSGRDLMVFDKRALDLADKLGVQPDLSKFVASQAKSRSIPVILAFAIIQQESGWMVDRISSGGNAGLFQIDQTMVDIAGPGDSGDQWIDVRVNVHVGLAYLQMALNKSEDRWQEAVGRYDAGLFSNSVNSDYVSAIRLQIQNWVRILK